MFLLEKEIKIVHVLELEDCYQYNRLPSVVSTHTFVETSVKLWNLINVTTNLI